MKQQSIDVAKWTQFQHDKLYDKINVFAFDIGLLQQVNMTLTYA